MSSPWNRLRDPGPNNSTHDLGAAAQSTDAIAYDTNASRATSEPGMSEHGGRDGERNEETIAPSPLQQAAKTGRQRGIDADLGKLCAARRERYPPPPSEYAEIIRRMATAESDTMSRRWDCAGPYSRPPLPNQRATWSASLAPSEGQRLCAEDAVWRELAQWRHSALQYAFPVTLWGRAADQAAENPWPPGENAICYFSSFFANGDSLQKYLSHLRSCSHLCHADLGCLANTSRFEKG